MTAAKPKTKKEFAVPVKVTGTRRVMKEVAPEVVDEKKSELKIQDAPVLKKNNFSDERRRRKIMWIAVGATMGLVLVVWVSLFGREMSSGKTDAIWGKVKQVFSSAGILPKETSAAEKEIRDLDKQVFPNLQK